MAGISSNAKRTAKPFLQTLPAKSSFLAAFQYDEVNMRLTIHMKDGKIYQYAQVFPSEWTALVTSQNHNKFYSDAIRGKKSSIKIKASPAPTSQLSHPRRSP